MASSIDSNHSINSSKQDSNQLPEPVAQLPPDPAHWTHAHLLTHLTQVDRDIAPDPIWVAAARRCIRTHSELIWERVKGGLGVPPELDWDYPFENIPYQKALELASTSGEFESSVEGTRRRKGSTTGKKERTESARMGERMRRLRAELRQGAPKQRLGLKGPEDESALDVEDDEHEVGIPPSLAKRWAGLQQQEGHGLAGSGTSTPTPEDPHSARSVGGFATRSKVAVDPNASKEAGRRDSIHEVGGMVVGEFTEETLGVNVTSASEGGDDIGSTAAELGDTEDDREIDEDEDIEGEEDDEVEIEIEPIIAPSPNSPFDSLSLGGANPPPPLSNATKELVDAGVASDVPAAEGVGLGDIAEGEEEDDENESEIRKEGEKEDAKKEGAGESTSEAGEGEEEDIIPASQIAGLRIKTAPVHAAGSYGVGGVSAISSPLPAGDSPRSVASGSHVISPPVGVGLGRSQSHSRTSSFSSLSGVSIGPFSRKESCGSAANLKELAKHYGSTSELGDGYGSDWSVGANAGSVKGAGSVRGEAGGNPESVGDRKPGEPLFVSNFARLNGCPTLAGANVNAKGAPLNVHSRLGKVKRSGSSSAIVGARSPAGSVKSLPGEPVGKSV